MKINARVPLFIVLIISALSYGRVDKKCTCGFHKYSAKKNLESPIDHTKSSSRIFDGRDAPYDRFPWQIMITIAETKPGQPIEISVWCGGVVISKKHILTAAHCLEFYFDGYHK